MISLAVRKDLKWIRKPEGEGESLYLPLPFLFICSMLLAARQKNNLKSLNKMLTYTIIMTGSDDFYVII